MSGERRGHTATRYQEVGGGLKLGENSSGVLNKVRSTIRCGDILNSRQHGRGVDKLEPSRRWPRPESSDAMAAALATTESRSVRRLRWPAMTARVRDTVRCCLQRARVIGRLQQRRRRITTSLPAHPAAGAMAVRDRSLSGVLQMVAVSVVDV